METSASVGSMTIEPPDGQFHFPLERGLDLYFDLVAAEQGDLVLIELDLVLEGRHDRTDEVQHVFVDRRASRSGLHRYPGADSPAPRG